MADEKPDNRAFIKGAGAMVGVFVSPVTGLLLAGHFGLNIATGTAVACLAGAVCGYGLASAYLLARGRRRDKELLFAVSSVIAEAGLPPSITVKVRDGHVTLGGEADAWDQRQMAERFVSSLPGVKDVSNKIRLRPSAHPVDPEIVKKEIEGAILRTADAPDIHVRVDNSRVILEGRVRSWIEASEAEEVAWAVPGILEVDNRLEITE
jgi:osmotically-inducible protein OsmY